MNLEENDFNYYDSAEQNVSEAFDLYEDGQLPRAIDQLDKAIEINPSNSSWHFDKALMLDSVNHFEEAIDVYKTALRLAPDDLEILNCLAVDYTRTGLYDKAIETFERIQGLDPSFEPCYCNRIITYAEIDKHDLAEQMFYLAQQITDDCPLCYYNIGNSLFIRGQFKKAVGCWIKTARLDSSHPQIHYRIAQAHWCDGNYAGAEKHFLYELRRNPGDTDVILDFGLMLLEADKIESAREKFSRVLELTPDSAPAAFYLGEARLKEGKSKEAARLFTQAARQDCCLKGPNFRLAEQAMQSGDYKKAREYLRLEKKLGIEDADVLTLIGMMFMEMAGADYQCPSAVTIANLDEASECFLDAVEVERNRPANGAARLLNSGLAYHLMALTIEARGRLCEAAKLLANSLDMRPGNVQAASKLADILLQMGQPDAAADRLGDTLRQAGTRGNLALSTRIQLSRLGRKLTAGLARRRAGR